jgi:hypothetical protein
MVPDLVVGQVVDERGDSNVGVRHPSERFELTVLSGIVQPESKWPNVTRASHEG